MTVVTEKRVHLSDRHFELNLWLNELKFYKDEIKIFNHRLEDIVSHESKREAMQHLEHFQNQFIRQEEVIDVLKHEVKQHENVLEKVASSGDDLDDSNLEQQNDLRDQVKQFKKIYYELKNEFMTFLTQWM